MATKVLALNTEGQITYCSAELGDRGKGRCNHIAHQEPGESVESFIARIDEKQKEINQKMKEDAEQNADSKEISQEEIDALASQIDEIAGERVTLDNLYDVLDKLPPDKVAEITRISFQAAPEFSLPITDEDYGVENLKNKIYFANLPQFGIAGNMASIKQMFDKVGEVPTLDGTEHIEHSYAEGLTPGEYFARQFGARDAMISKGIRTSQPGFCIYENSSVFVKNDMHDFVKTKWKDIEVGFEFIDGSVIEEIQPWTYKRCYELQLKGNEKIILSHDHLLYGEILVNGTVVDFLEKSDESRKNVGETDKKWICVEDIYEFFQLGAKIDISNDGAELLYINKFKNGEPQRVRCISTNTGFYETNGMIHHNTARKLFYAMSDTMVVEDCGGPYIDALHCNLPEGHICEKCAHLTSGGENIHVGQLVGGWVSTNLSEGVTQLSMKQMHVGSAQVAAQQSHSSVIMATLDGWGTSPIIQKMKEAKTTDEMRDILYHGLKDQYADAGLAQDDFNLQMVARKLTSYKRENGELRPVQPNEKCDIISIATAGNAGNIFKTSELSSGYQHLTRPTKQKLKKDAANQILR